MLLFGVLAIISEETSVNTPRNDFITQEGLKSNYRRIPTFLTATVCDASIVLILFLLNIIIHYILGVNNKNKFNLSKDASFGQILCHSIKQTVKKICSTLVPRYLVCRDFEALKQSVEMENVPMEQNKLSYSLLDSENNVDSDLDARKENVDKNSDDKHLNKPRLTLDESYIRAILEEGIQIKTGWIVLTWQLFVIELYLLSSEEIGGQMVKFTHYTQCYIYFGAVIVHLVIICVAIAVGTLHIYIYIYCKYIHINSMLVCLIAIGCVFGCYMLLIY